MPYMPLLESYVWYPVNNPAHTQADENKQPTKAGNNERERERNENVVCISKVIIFDAGFCVQSMIGRNRSTMKRSSGVSAITRNVKFESDPFYPLLFTKKTWRHWIFSYFFLFSSLFNINSWCHPGSFERGEYIRSLTLALYYMILTCHGRWRESVHFFFVFPVKEGGRIISDRGDRSCRRRSQKTTTKLFDTRRRRKKILTRLNTLFFLSFQRCWFVFLLLLFIQVTSACEVCNYKRRIELYIEVNIA